MGKFDLTKFKYLKPKSDEIGYIGRNNIFLLEPPLGYYLAPHTVYQIIPKQYQSTSPEYQQIKKWQDRYNYQKQDLYILRDLKTMLDHILVVESIHDESIIKLYFELYD
jgi:hypothetical protein